MMQLIIFDLMIFLIILLLHTFTTLTLSALRFQYKQFMIPHPQKAHRGGQDAYYVNDQMIVVADGVGGWNNQGIDPSKFSRFLASQAYILYKEKRQYYLQNPRQLVKGVHEPNQHIGSSTLLMITLDNGVLKSCNIGDCAYLLFRKNKNDTYELIYESLQQQHKFNFPFQLAPLNLQGTDSSQTAICISIKLKEDDIVLAGSDGLFDNIYINRLQQAVYGSLTNDTLLTDLGPMLAAEAIGHGSNLTYFSPFAQNARNKGLSYLGGKLDDTTIVVAKVINKIQDVLEE